MSVVCEDKCGWFVDHKLAVEKHYSCVKDNSHEMRYLYCYKCPDEMFDIKTQFYTDTKFHAQLQRANQPIPVSQNIPGADQNATKKKRKRKLSLNEGEKEALFFHEQVVQILKAALKQLICIAVEKGKIHQKQDTICQDNNINAREFARLEGPGDSLMTLCETAKDLGVSNQDTTYLSQNDYVITKSVVNTMVKFESSEENGCLMNLFGADYLIPANSSFLMSDITCSQSLLQEKKKFDLVVLDPPWENKSIKRKKKYYTMEDCALLQLPMKELCTNNCVYFVWVTNKQRQHRFVKEDLFPRWNVSYRAHWYWLKVTKYGEPVVPLDSSTKKPYECIIIGTSDASINIPQDKVIVSIPCATHSRKPPLNDIIKSVFQGHKTVDANNLNCLEMFARNLIPGWTSWGNEVLKHQSTEFFNKEKLTS